VIYSIIEFITHADMKIPFLCGLLIMMLHGCNSLTAKEKRQVDREIKKQIMELEERLMASDTCTIASCSSGMFIVMN